MKVEYGRTCSLIFSSVCCLYVLMMASVFTCKANVFPEKYVTVLFRWCLPHFSLVVVLHALSVFRVYTCIRIVTVVVLACLQFWDRPPLRSFLSSPLEVIHILGSNWISIYTMHAILAALLLFWKGGSYCSHTDTHACPHASANT